jgi:hypothetical protein
MRAFTPNITAEYHRRISPHRPSDQRLSQSRVEHIKCPDIVLSAAGPGHYLTLSAESTLQTPRNPAYNIMYGTTASRAPMDAYRKIISMNASSPRSSRRKPRRGVAHRSLLDRSLLPPHLTTRRHAHGHYYISKIRNFSPDFFAHARKRFFRTLPSSSVPQWLSSTSSSLSPRCSASPQATSSRRLTTPATFSTIAPSSSTTATISSPMG